MSQRPPDILFRNLRLGDGTPSAIAVFDGRITAIGAGAEATPAMNVIDLGGALALPGFVEGHMMIGYRSGLLTDDELEAAFDIVTANGARALGITEYGLEIGAPANFVVVKAAHIPEAVVAVPKPRSVYRYGKCIVRDGVLQK
ncbi:MAG: hypothetical protein BGN91_08550 [Nitrobacter sp. 62-13]|nr:MAG: hypothetical protein BGN91_08550 [Nitrobacter sp. 62-13]